MKKTRRFIFAGLIAALTACADAGIDARNRDIIDEEPDLMRESVDYLTYLKLKKGAGPLDQDYILLGYRLIGDMTRDDFFKNKGIDRPKIALRDVLNYHPTAEVRPAIIHEAIEHGLMNTRALWTVDDSAASDFVMDVELSEVDVKNFDKNAEEKALGEMIVLFDPYGREVKSWFGILKRAKGEKDWY